MMTTVLKKQCWGFVFGSVVKGTDPLIRIRIRTKMSRIPNTVKKRKFSFETILLKFKAKN
jgi:hypothetical protein